MPIAACEAVEMRYVGSWMNNTWSRNLTRREVRVGRGVLTQVGEGIFEGSHNTAIVR